MYRRPRFLIWLAILAGVALFANTPRGGGPMKGWLSWAGCPWIFAVWQGNSLEEFSLRALFADMAIAGAIILPVAWLCSRSRDVGATAADQVDSRESRT